MRLLKFTPRLAREPNGPIPRNTEKKKKTDGLSAPGC